MTAALTSIYPTTSRDRDRWIVDRRPHRNAVDPTRPYAFFAEEECSSTGESVSVATIFLTNRECPWRCLMCDLWKNTLTHSVAPGSIPAQIAYALDRLPPARQIKLYNSGSFFDLRAIPLEDHLSIAEQLSAFDRVIVECHPSLVGDNCFQFSEQLNGKLEVAMGLETAHPQVLEKLNKRMTLEQFASSADKLDQHNVDLRVFVLLNPPFMKNEQSLEWAAKSLDFAFACKATAATIIPTRAANGAVDELALSGDFAAPRLSTLEAAVEYGLDLHEGRVFSDLWETAHLTGCLACSKERIERLKSMNIHQQIPSAIDCNLCGEIH